MPKGTSSRHCHRNNQHEIMSNVAQMSASNRWPRRYHPDSKHMMLCAFRRGLDRSFDRLVTLLEQSDATTIVHLPVTPYHPILRPSGVTRNAIMVVTFSLAYDFTSRSRLGDTLEGRVTVWYFNHAYTSLMPVTSPQHSLEPSPHSSSSSSSPTTTSPQSSPQRPPTAQYSSRN